MIMSKWTDGFPKSEITGSITGETVKFAEDFAKELNDGNKKNSKNFTTSQLRKFFGEVKRQQMNGYNETDFVLLKPKLAYAVGRADKNKEKTKLFYEVLSVAIDEVQKGTTENEKAKRFKNFIQFFEAIVAYHKSVEDSVKNDFNQENRQFNNKNNR
jgi:CRISPR-associated protein Csm2